MSKVSQEIWYVSKYAVPAKFGNPTRQYFFSKYMSRRGRNVTLVSSKSASLDNFPIFGLSNEINYISEDVKGVLLNGPHIHLGFNLKRIYSWIIFEFRLLYWALFKRKTKPNVIIVSSLSLLTFITGVILKKIYKCKLVCEVRDIWPLTVVQTKTWGEGNVIIRILGYIERVGYKNADFIIGTMPNLKEHVASISNVYSEKVHHIPMGFDPEFWDAAIIKEEDDPFLTFFNENIPSDHFVVGYAGTMGLVNCVDQILAVAKRLKSEKITFVFLGSGSLRDKLLEESIELGLKNVHFLAPVPKNRVSFFLKRCDLLVNPWKGGNELYRYGVSPNKWIDYMYSEKPILVSLDGYHSIINEAKCGKFIEADNVEEFTKWVHIFSRMDRSTLKEMGRNGKKYLMEHMTYHSLTEKYLKLIDT